MNLVADGVDIFVGVSPGLARKIEKNDCRDDDKSNDLIINEFIFKRVTDENKNTEIMKSFNSKSLQIGRISKCLWLKSSFQSKNILHC